MSTATVTSIPQGTWKIDPSHSSVEFQVKHMGLATVKGIVTERGGALEIESVPGRGSRFSVYLPASRDGGAVSAT